MGIRTFMYMLACTLESLAPIKKKTVIIEPPKQRLHAISHLQLNAHMYGNDCARFARELDYEESKQGRVPGQCPCVSTIESG